MKRPTNMFLLLQGQFVSNLGNQIYDIALLLWIKELTGSAAIMGLALLLTNLPEALLAPLGGTLADRYGKVRIMVLSDLVSGLSVGLVVVACLLASNVKLKLISLGITNIVLGMAAACFSPAVSALLPSLVARNRLAKANAAQQFCSVGARVLGQSAGGFVFIYFGAMWAFGINAVSFLLSSVSEIFIRPPRDRESKSLEEKDNSSIFRDTGIGLKRVWNDHGLRTLVLYIGAFHLCLSSLPILLPFLAEKSLNLSGQWVGFFIGAYTIGILCGFILAGLLSSFNWRRENLIAASAILVGLMFWGVGLSPMAVLTIPALVAIGTGIGLIIVNLMTQLQLASAESERGRIMGAAQAVGGSSLPIGMALFGLLLDGAIRWGVPTPIAIMVIFFGCGTVAVFLGIGLLNRFGSPKRH